MIQEPSGRAGSWHEGEKIGRPEAHQLRFPVRPGPISSRHTFDSRERGSIHPRHSSRSCWPTPCAVRPSGRARSRSPWPWMKRASRDRPAGQHQPASKRGVREEDEHGSGRGFPNTADPRGPREACFWTVSNRLSGVLQPFTTGVGSSRGRRQGEKDKKRRWALETRVHSSNVDVTVAGSTHR